MKISCLSGGTFSLLTNSQSEKREKKRKKNKLYGRLIYLSILFSYSSLSSLAFRASWRLRWWIRAQHLETAQILLLLSSGCFKKSTPYSVRTSAMGGGILWTVSQLVLGPGPDTGFHSSSSSSFAFCELVFFISPFTVIVQQKAVRGGEIISFARKARRSNVDTIPSFCLLCFLLLENMARYPLGGSLYIGYRFCARSGFCIGSHLYTRNYLCTGSYLCTGNCLCKCLCRVNSFHFGIITARDEEDELLQA